MKKIVAIICAIILCASYTPFVFAFNSTNTYSEDVEIEGMYHASEIMSALERKSRSSYALNSSDKAILNDVLLPTSMGITIPNIDPSKVIQTVDVYSLDPAFAEALADHGVYRSRMTFSEYEKIESTWLLPDEFISIARISYPELQDVDMSSWTYGTYKEYTQNKDEERFLARFSSEQLQELNARGILIDDLSILISSYHTIDNILSQSNQDLKATIEAAYRFTYEKFQAEADPSRATPPSADYTPVSFPGFMNGQPVYFANSVLTTYYWRGIQSARALKMQQALYSSSATTLHCTNLHGTYSTSSNGAHEGIDFVHPDGYNTPSIRAMFSGVRVVNPRDPYRLLVYDASSPHGDERTYAYLHMSLPILVSGSSQVSVYQTVGQQGNQGGEYGYHVHFEVNAGRSEYTSEQNNDHTIESLSPYWLVHYIGCSGSHTYIWAADRNNHWHQCSICTFTTTMHPHLFSNNFCTTCGWQQDTGLVSK